MTEHRVPGPGSLGDREGDGPDTGPVAIPGVDAPVSERTDMRGVIEQAEDRGCPECGATNPPRDGACPACGSPRVPARDRLEFVLGSCVGVTDRGLRRRRNEDAVGLGRVATPAGEVLVGVVCDGVASARRGDEASLAAVERAVGAVVDSVEREGPHGLDALGALAASAAADAVADLVRDGDANDPPACTYVGAVVRDGSAVVSWVGDSRIYWLASDGTSQLLSVDDSWAEEIAAAGLMTHEEAHADRRAHVLTNWLGHDSPPGPARARRFRPATPGLLMLCSDGLWNHVPDADDLAAVVGSGDVLADARTLVAAALDDGGFDNTTVALLPVVPGTGDGEWSRAREDDTGPILLPGELHDSAAPDPGPRSRGRGHSE